MAFRDTLSLRSTGRAPGPSGACAAVAVANAGCKCLTRTLKPVRSSFAPAGGAVKTKVWMTSALPTFGQPKAARTGAGFGRIMVASTSAEVDLDCS